MTKEVIRIAVAESMGWKLSPPNRSWPKPYWTSPIDHVLRTFDELPDYCTDLNACAVFEKTLSANEACLYHGKLQGVVLRDWNAYPDDLPVIVSYSASATAIQRCEAYLRVKGLWVEGGAK